MPSFKITHQEFKPPEELSDTIKCFWYESRDSKEQQSDFEVMPDGYAEIIFYFGSLSSVAYNEGIEPLPSPFIMGLLNQPALLTTQNRLEIIGIRCFPWTIFDLLGLPSGKDGMRIIEHPIARLQPLLTGHIRTGNIDGAIAQVIAYFVTARSGIATDSLLFKAGAAMKQANGKIPVSEVAAAAHATIRTLERKFKHSSGYSVKDVSGLMRFEQVRNRLWHYPDSNLAALAHELGYTDQSHLNREFKRYSSTTPAAFARNNRKKKQGINNDFVAFIQS